MSPLARAARATFSSLRVRNYRLFLTGQFVSMSGTWMQWVALGWLILELTGSGFAVGGILAVQFLPVLLFGMWGGVIADHFDKRRVLMITQSAASGVALILWGITLTDVAAVWLIYMLTFLQGCVTSVDNPTRQSFVTEMVGPDGVANAVSLNSAVFNASRIIGPALAGVAIATVGLPWAFLINSLSYIAMFVALFLMDPSRLQLQERSQEKAGRIMEGLRYVWHTHTLRYTVLMVTIVATFGFNFSVVLPLMARFTFDKGAGTFALLTSLMAAGALIGALVSAARARPTRRLVIGSAGVFGSLVLIASAAPNLATLAVLLVPIGAASITFIASANSMLQLNSIPSMRGRVMALHGLVFLGSTPIGAPIVGWAAEHWGPRFGLGIGGAATLFAAVLAVALIKRDRLRAGGRPTVKVQPYPVPTETPEEASAHTAA